MCCLGHLLFCHFGSKNNFWVFVELFHFFLWQNYIYKNLDFGVDLDTRVALVGPNGAGKSTLLKLIVGEVSGEDASVCVVSST